jgi:hypothetical protein
VGDTVSVSNGVTKPTRLTIVGTATMPMLLWTLSRPFEGFFGNKDSGQTNDGPLVLEGKLLSGHASS